MTERTNKILAHLKQEKIIAKPSGFVLPNHSGDHSRGKVRVTAVGDTDIANKKYVDDNAGGINIGASTDNAIVRWDGVAGNAVQDTTEVTISDEGETTIAAGTLTSGGTNDLILNLTRTLNDSGAAGGSDLFNGILMDITETDTTGWDNVRLMDLRVGGNSRFMIDNDGGVVLGNQAPTRITNNFLTLARSGSNVCNLSINTGATGFGGSDGFQFQVGTTGNALLVQREAQPMALLTSGSTRVHIEADGDVGIGDTTPSAQLQVSQTSTTAAQPVFYMEQSDVSEEFMRFQGSAAAATLTQSIVAEADVTTATRQGFVKVHVVDDGNQITDQDYFMPIFTLA